MKEERIFFSLTEPDFEESSDCSLVVTRRINRL